uniref:Uncharacterized protein n=1 Tax=Arundo donax TaxID=35708 RepID=A0A0A8ZYR6_ARUDO
MFTCSCMYEANNTGQCMLFIYFSFCSYFCLPLRCVHNHCYKVKFQKCCIHMYPTQ